MRSKCEEFYCVYVSDEDKNFDVKEAVDGKEGFLLLKKKNLI